MACKGKKVCEAVKKKCPKCGVEKTHNDFYKCKKHKDGLAYQCKACEKAIKSEYYNENRDNIKAKQAAYDSENKNKVKVRRAKYYQNNKDKLLLRCAEYYKNNMEKMSAKHTEYSVNRYRTDPLFSARHRIRVLTLRAFKRGKFTKRSRTFGLVGCSMEDLLLKWCVQEIPEGWHIDHIVPMAQAKTIEEVEKLCHWRNLQLLPARENIEKSDNMTEQNAALCLDLLGREWA